MAQKINFKTLTDADVQALLEAFKAVSIKHTNQEAAKEQIEFARDLCESFAIVVLAGPTGVGKSRLISKVVEDHFAQCTERMRADSTFIPVIATLAIAHGHRKFDFRRFYLDCLAALGDPFAGKRSHSAEQKERAKKIQFRSAGESISAALLRMDLELELERHGTLAWVIDEADHILTGGASGLPGDQFDVLKSLAQKTGITLLLSGTGKLPTYLAASGQLSRRSDVIVLSHYKWDSDADVAQYASVFHTLMQRLPIEGFPAVESNLEEFFIGGVGCVGVAKDWIARAFARMLKERKGVVTMAHFRDTRLSPVQLKTMALELAHAEEWVRSAKSDNELKLLLGVKPRPSSDAQSAKGQPAKPTKSRGKPFTRRPGRDPVGGVRGAEGGAAA